MRSVHHSVTGGKDFASCHPVTVKSGSLRVWHQAVYVCVNDVMVLSWNLSSWTGLSQLCVHIVFFFLFCSFHTAHISVLYPNSHARWFLSVPSCFLLKIREIVCFVQSGPALMLEVGWHLLHNVRIWNNTWINNKQCKYEACITFYISINELKTADVIQTESERVKPASVEC